MQCVAKHVKQIKICTILYFVDYLKSMLKIILKSMQNQSENQSTAFSVIYKVGLSNTLNQNSTKIT
jgi:hypothetical protein